jgi:hypothetical protein
MRTWGAFSAKAETGFASSKCSWENPPSDPFDGRPCNMQLQGMPGAELALMHRFNHAALPGSNGGSIHDA